MKKIVLILAGILFFGGFVNAQDAELAKYKAMFTTNFIRYVGWTDEAKQGDFVIGVYKASMVKDQLESQTAGKKFGYQNIVIKEFKKLEDATDCQIFYHGGNFGKDAASVKQTLKNKNSLIITESGKATDAGSMINFVILDDRLKFEVHAANAASFGLKFSSSLTSLSNAIAK